MNIYVASSWRNPQQPAVVDELRRGGYEVYDFRDPKQGGFHWSQIDPEWEGWTPAQYRLALQTSPLAEAGLYHDMDALRRCDAVVAVQPFGRSASLELGWAAGAGKITILLLAPGEPELMVKMCDRICLTLEEVIDCLDEYRDGG
jgi:hypothetical protein